MNEYCYYTSNIIPKFKFPQSWLIQLLPTELSLVAFKVTTEVNDRSVNVALYPDNVIYSISDNEKNIPCWVITSDKGMIPILIPHNDVEGLIEKINSILFEE